MLLDFWRRIDDLLSDRFTSRRGQWRVDTTPDALRSQSNWMLSNTNFSTNVSAETLF